MDAQNRCPPMPTQNPWVWVGMGTQCRALYHTIGWIYKIKQKLYFDDKNPSI